MRSQPRPDQPLVRMIDERRAPLAKTVFSFVNGGVKIPARIRADQIGKDFVKDAAQQRGRRRARAPPPARRTVNLSANIADLQSDCHDKNPYFPWQRRKISRLYVINSTNRNNTAGGS